MQKYDQTNSMYKRNILKKILKAKQLDPISLSSKQKDQFIKLYFSWKEVDEKFVSFLVYLIKSIKKYKTYKKYKTW